MTLGDPPTKTTSIRPTPPVTHFVPYGSYDSSCGRTPLPSFCVDHRDVTTCVECLQVMLDKTEANTEANVIYLIEKHLEECLSEPTSKGWKQQIADSLIRSFEIGEKYGKQIGWDEGADAIKMWENFLSDESPKNPYRVETVE